MSAVLVVSAAIVISSAQHMIYEPHPEGHQIREPGLYGQDCTPQSGDYPDKCPQTRTGDYVSKISNIIECQHNFDCCLCREMVCGTPALPDCGGIICNGDSSCFGVKDIKMVGDPVYGASLNCNGDLSCMGTKVDGTNIVELYCTGDGSCAFSRFNIDCIVENGEGCPLLCAGDNACEGDPTDPRKIGYYEIRNSSGMTCSHDACRSSTFVLTENLGGAVNCNGEESCNSADITINNIEAIYCGGVLACFGSSMLILNPKNAFALMCTGPKGCMGANIEIMVTDPDITFIEPISCISVKGCLGATFTVTKWGATELNGLEIGELSCGAAASCNDVLIDLGPHVTVTQCRCARNACSGLLGVPSCPKQEAYQPPAIATVDPYPLGSHHHTTTTTAAAAGHTTGAAGHTTGAPAGHITTAHHV